MRKIIVKTERLRIVPLSIEELRLLRDGEPDDGMKQAYGEMMDAVRRSPGREEWGTYWNICLTSGTRVGGLCFKGAPDAEGGVEIGYGIDEAYRRLCLGGRDGRHKMGRGTERRAPRDRADGRGKRRLRKSPLEERLYC